MSEQLQGRNSVELKNFALAGKLCLEVLEAERSRVDIDVKVAPIDRKLGFQVDGDRQLVLAPRLVQRRTDLEFETLSALVLSRCIFFSFRTWKQSKNSNLTRIKFMLFNEGKNIRTLRRDFAGNFFCWHQDSNPQPSDLVVLHHRELRMFKLCVRFLVAETLALVPAARSPALLVNSRGLTV